MRVLTITTPDLENGLGYRVTIWVAGCSHHCPGCHNPHTWVYDQGKPLLDKDVQEKIFEEVSKPYIKGITLSGGDPLSQSYDSLCDLDIFLKIFREEFHDKDVWIFAGETYEEAITSPVKRNILEKCDVMVDGPFKIELKDPDIPFRGSKNQRIIDLKQTIKENKIVNLKMLS